MAYLGRIVGVTSHKKNRVKNLFLILACLVLSYTAQAAPCDPIFSLFTTLQNACPEANCVTMSVRLENNGEEGCRIAGELENPPYDMPFESNPIGYLKAFRRDGWDDLAGFIWVDYRAKLEPLEIVGEISTFVNTYNINYFHLSYRPDSPGVLADSYNIPIHFSEIEYDEGVAEADENACQMVTCRGGKVCAAGECVCPSGTDWSEGSEACVDAEVCEEFPEICAGAGGLTGSAAAPSPGGSGPTGSASGGGSCTQLASHHASNASLAWLGLLFLTLGLYRLRHHNRV